MQKGTAVAVNHSMFKKDFNPFEILGIEPAFEVEATALDAAYFSRQALAHPDRFVYHSEPERQAAAEQSASLNQAYEILKNPALRARAILKLRGIEGGGEDGKTVQDPLVLEEMMGLRETLMEAVSPYDFNVVESQIQERLQEATASFARAARQDQNQKLPGFFLRLTYLSKLMEDIKMRRRQSSVKVL